MASARNNAALITNGDLALWKKESARIAGEIVQLEAQKTKLDAMIAQAIALSDMAKSFAQGGLPQTLTVKTTAINEIDPTSPFVGKSAAMAEPLAKARKAKKAVKVKRKILRNSDGQMISYPNEILRVLTDANGPVSYAELRANLMKGPMKAKLAQNDKGFYGAIGKLDTKGDIKKYKGHLFTKEVFEAFESALAAGAVADLSEVQSSGRKSPLGEAILKYIGQMPHGATGKDIVSYLIEKTEFSETINRNKSGAYNVLSRLVKAEQLTKGEDGIFRLALNENDPAFEPGHSPERGGAGTPQSSLF